MSEYNPFSVSSTSAPADTTEGTNPALQSVGLSTPKNTALSIFLANASTTRGLISDHKSILASFSKFSLIGIITANSAALIYLFAHACLLVFFLPLFVVLSTNFLTEVTI